MQFSEKWLKEFIDINISTEELCEQLTMLGLEVDGYEKYKSKITGDDSIIKLDITPQIIRIASSRFNNKYLWIP